MPALMPFGQYKGWNLEDIPINYLLWLNEDGNIFGSLKWSIESILEERFKERDAIGNAKITQDDRKNLIALEPMDIQQWWEYYARVFENVFYGIHLKRPNLTVQPSRRFMGYWAPGIRELNINNYYILPQNRFENILIHEMCHQYITEMNIADTSPHGRRWRNIAASMSSATSNIINICDNDIYAVNDYFQPGKLVILPEKEETRKKAVSVESAERSYEGFIEELSNA